MTSVLIKDLSRSLGREELLAVRGGILLMERPPEEGAQPVDFCGGTGGAPSFPGLPTLPGLPTFPGAPDGWPRNCWEPSGPSGPCGPALDPRVQ